MLIGLSHAWDWRFNRQCMEISLADLAYFLNDLKRSRGRVGTYYPQSTTWLYLLVLWALLSLRLAQFSDFMHLILLAARINIYTGLTMCQALLISTYHPHFTDQERKAQKGYKFAHVHQHGSIHVKIQIQAVSLPGLCCQLLSLSHFGLFSTCPLECLALLGFSKCLILQIYFQMRIEELKREKSQRGKRKGMSGREFMDSEAVTPALKPRHKRISFSQCYYEDFLSKGSNT